MLPGCGSFQLRVFEASRSGYSNISASPKCLADAGPVPQRFSYYNWPEISQCPKLRPDQTAAEVLTDLQARYPGFHGSSLSAHIACLQFWRQHNIHRMICEMNDYTQDGRSVAATNLPRKMEFRLLTPSASDRASFYGS